MGGSDTGHTGTDEELADLADVILALARVISADRRRDPEFVTLTHTEITVMRFIDRNPGASPAAVAAGTGLQRSNASRTIGDLEAKGLVSRTDSETDGRQVRLRPTGRAAANRERLRGNWARLLSSAGADPRNLAAALAYLAELESGLGRLPSVKPV